MHNHNSLEVNLHQLILSDLARNVGQSKDNSTGSAIVEDTVDLLSSKVETRGISEEEEVASGEQARVFMVCFILFRCTTVKLIKAEQSTSRISCNIGFAELAPNIPESHVTSAVSGLIEILRDVPYIDFDRTLSWNGELACPMPLGIF